LRPGDQRTLALAIDARRDTSAEVPERRVGQRSGMSPE
jgi:hypothetical protein